MSDTERKQLESEIFRESPSFDMLKAVNYLRETNGSGPLVQKEEWMRCAQAHAERMQNTGIFAHQGTQEYDSLCKWNGENIAWNYSSYFTALGGWMKSPGHRANILNRGFRSLGWGKAGPYYVQIFGA